MKKFVCLLGATLLTLQFFPLGWFPAAQAAKSSQRTVLKPKLVVPPCVVVVTNACQEAIEPNLYVNQAILVNFLKQELCALDRRYTLGHVETTCTGITIVVYFMKDGELETLRVQMPLKGDESYSTLRYGAYGVVQMINSRNTSEECR